MIAILLVLTYRAQFASQQRSNRQPVPVSRWAQSYADPGLEKGWGRLLQLNLAASTHRAYGPTFQELGLPPALSTRLVFTFAYTCMPTFPATTWHLSTPPPSPA